MPKKKWQKPILHDHSQEGHEHRVSWLELFYDLTFVVTISQLTHHLAEEISLASIGTFIFLFIPVWWAWIGMTYYSDRFETDDVSQRLFTFLSIIGVASIAYHIPHALDSTSTGFILSYTFVRSILVVLWVRAGIHNKKFRPYSNRYLVGFMLSIIVWLISIFVPGPWKFILWGIGLLIEYITPLTTLRIKNRIPSLNNSKHLPERFGLFMIIVLGESIIGIVRGLSNIEVFSSISLIISILGAAFTFMIWWLYFDHINERTVKKGVGYLIGWSYGHLPLVMSIAALGAGIINLVEQTGAVLNQPTLWLVCGTVSVSLFSMGLIELTLQKKEHTPCSSLIGKWTRFGGAIVCLILPFIPYMNRPAPLLSTLIILFVIQILQGETSPDHAHEDHAFLID